MIRSASEIFCDATDNNLRFGKVTIAAGGGSEATADVWMLPKGLWSRSSSNGFILDDSARVFITESGRNNTTFAHELSHAILTLSDSYNEQSRLGRFYGIGPSIDPGRCSITGDSCASNENCQAFETCSGSNITATENTMMGDEYSTPRCSVSNKVCDLGDIECDGGGDACEILELYSEYSVDSNHDVLLGDNASCPTKRKIITGLLGDDAPVNTFDFDTFEEVEASSSGEKKLRFIDSLGVVAGYERDSSHNLWVYAEHRNAATREWTPHFLMDGKHLDEARLRFVW